MANIQNISNKGHRSRRGNGMASGGAQIETINSELVQVLDFLVYISKHLLTLRVLVKFSFCAIISVFLGFSRRPKTSLRILSPPSGCFTYLILYVKIWFRINDDHMFSDGWSFETYHWAFKPNQHYLASILLLGLRNIWKSKLLYLDVLSGKSAGSNRWIISRIWSRYYQTNTDKWTISIYYTYFSLFKS